MAELRLLVDLPLCTVCFMKHCVFSLKWFGFCRTLLVTDLLSSSQSLEYVRKFSKNTIFTEHPAYQRSSFLNYKVVTLCRMNATFNVPMIKKRCNYFNSNLWTFKSKGWGNRHNDPCYCTFTKPFIQSGCFLDKISFSDIGLTSSLQNTDCCYLVL